MTGKELMARLTRERGRFDAKLAAVPAERLDEVPEGHTHSPKEIVAHVNAYEALIVERLRAARMGETTAFFRDREGWEEFNDRVWGEVAGADASEVIARSHRVFADLMDEVSGLTDEELNGPVGVTAAIDPAWLKGETLAELIAVDAYDHYPMHHRALEAAAG